MFNLRRFKLGDNKELRILRLLNPLKSLEERTFLSVMQRGKLRIWEDNSLFYFCVVAHRNSRNLSLAINTSFCAFIIFRAFLC